MKARDILLAPFWLAQLATAAKSFRDNPILGSPTLNAWGLHAARRRLADSLAQQRRARLASLLSPRESADFERDGYFVRRNALAPEAFATLRREMESCKLPAREMRQGQTVTRRIGLDDAWLGALPATRAFVKDPAVRALLHYAAACGGEPTFAVQSIIADPTAGERDPQTIFHSDTFHPTAKAWLFLVDVGEDDGPFAYVPGSHRLTPRRLEWERAQSLGARSSEDQMHGEGSFRAGDTDFEALELPSPTRMAVPANTLIVADTSGFHARSASPKATHRVEIYATLRRTPFVPWLGLHLLAMPPIAGRHARLETALQRFVGSPWRPVGEAGPFEPARI